jgi:demethylmenaquinone methyltransferase/2-methoxy-6-polyprenyl-1,4-benzoquinol methylase
MPDNTEKQQPPLTAEEYIRMLNTSNRITEKAIRNAIGKLGLFDGCQVLDIPCGIGSHSLWMAEENPNAEILGVDIAAEHLSAAKQLVAHRGGGAKITFEKGNMKALSFDDNGFDFLWCCDGLWPGTPEQGCITSNPYTVLGEFKRVVKPGGTIAIVFWTAQKLFPGYPLLETTLTATVSANRPSRWNTDPNLHILRAPLWLQTVGLENIRCRTFACDIVGPFSQEDEVGMVRMAEMFWGKAEAEVSPEIWEQYKRITDPGSRECIFRKEGYAGFVTYTMYTGNVV